MNKRIRAIIGQRRKPLNLRDMMDRKKILIVNLSKGKLGEDNSSLLGSLFVSSLQQAAMSRADIPESERNDFYLFVDEFQNFTTSSFGTILSEARKYRLNLTVAHQYLNQLNAATLDAVTGNIGSKIAFQVGSDDAEAMAAQLSKHVGQLTPNDMTNLPRFTAYARLETGGTPAPPFTLKTPKPIQLRDDAGEAVRAMSRRQFARPLILVQEQIAKQISA